MTLKSVVGKKEHPALVHVSPAVIRFPDGTVSGNWKNRPNDKSKEYVRLDLIVGWREYDWPEGFDRATAQMIVDHVEKRTAN